MTGRFRRMLHRTILLVLIGVILPAAGVAIAAPRDPRDPRALRFGSQTHLPLPRFASIRAPVANLRRGPGFRYPIMWQYRRRHLPVLIVREFGNWRLLRLPGGTHGWMHRAMLTRRRTFVVIVGRATLRGAPRANAEPVAHLRRGVLGMLHRCGIHTYWCSVSTHGFEGFLKQDQIWGSNANARHVRG